MNLVDYMNFMQKKKKKHQNMFLKVSQQKAILRTIKYNFNSYIYASSLFLSFQAGHLYIWSVSFLNYWHLAPPFPPAPEWSFLIKLTSFAFHKLCC